MDHLPLPSDLSHALPRVPCVCDSAEPYMDDGDWITYPARVGWPQAVVTPEFPSFTTYDFSHPCNDGELEKFFQAWIWFGLLKLMLGRVGLYDAQDYLEDCEPSGGDDRPLRKLVHTKTLMQRLNGWRDIASTWPDKERDEALNEMISALYRVEAVTGVLTQDLDIVSTPRHMGFDRGIKLSILALCDALVYTIDATFPDSEGSHHERLAAAWSNRAIDAAWGQAMANASWCAGEIAAARRGFAGFAVHQYLGYLRKPDLGIDHIECDAEGCVKLQIDASTYETLHVSSGCHCPDKGPDVAEIAKCLQAGTYPILRVLGDNISGGITVDAIPYVKGMAFVAISHVWADGLGNPKSNVLPSCQLVRLRSLIASLQCRKQWKDGGESGPPDDRELFLWCDTLCCPVVEIEAMNSPPRSHKQLALGRMRKVYTQATYILVLERSLYLYSNRDIGMIESAMRLLTSRWMQRLWTFQEAVLPKALLIQYSDRAVDFRELFEGAKRLYQNDLQYRGLALDIEGHCHRLRAFFHLEGEERPDIWDLSRAVCHRRVSVPSDEALCISIVLDLDEKAIAEVSTHERRMEILWTLVHNARRGISNSIIFNTLPRLKRPGFRWAPATFQQPTSKGLQFLKPVNENERLASLCDEGIMVRCPALRISMPPSFAGINGGWLATREDKDGVSLRMDLGNEVRWFRLSGMHYVSTEREGETLRDVLRDPSRAQMLILQKPYDAHDGQEPEIVTGLIASWMSMAGERDLLRSAMTVRLRAADADSESILFWAFEGAQRLKQDPDALLLCECSSQSRKESAEFKSAFQAFEKRSSEILDEAMESEHLRAILVRRGFRKPRGAFGYFLARFFKGDYAHVLERYGTDHEWCVD